MPSETQFEGSASPSRGTPGVAVPERRKQIKLTATPGRRAIPAVIASATDDGAEGLSSFAEHSTPFSSPEGALSDIAFLAEAIGGDAIFILDRALRFSFANRAAESLLGRSADALRGRPFAALAPDAGENGDSALLAHIRDSLRSGKAEALPIHLESKQKRYQVFITPHAEGVFACLRDITDREILPLETLETPENYTLVEQMIELAPDMVYLHDLTLGVNIYSNANTALALGYTPEELAIMSPAMLQTIIVPEDRERRNESRTRFSAETPIIESEYRIVHKSGSIRWLRTRETVFGRDGEGKPRLILGFAQDVTERRYMVEMLAQREEYLRRLTESSPDCIFTLDAKGNLLQLNPSGKRLMEIADFAPLTGAEWALLFLESYRNVARHAIKTALNGGSERFQGIAKTATGTPLWWDVVVTPVPDKEGKPTQILTVARDITYLKSREAERERLLQETILRADYDPLTGLLNQGAFHRRLLEVAAQKTPVAILLFDLENFEYFNDAFGRSVGDDLLIRMARELSVCCRSVDTFARTGPDEFGIVAAEIGPEEIDVYIQRLRVTVDGISVKSPDGPETIPLHVAIGYAFFPLEADNPNAAYDLAEERRRADQTTGHSREAERVRDSLREVVDSFGMFDTLIATIDSKDRMTRRQSEDTLVHSRRIAEKCGLSSEQKRSLDIAALLHDVGKVGIDERILRQPGRLNDDDFAMVQQHPKIGAMLVGSTVDDVDTVEAILYHHENWNGTGYPAGLSGEEIPLLARILNVASSYAAMTNNRPYRKGMPPDAALKVIQNGAGTQWDPECAAALIEAVSR